MFVAEYAGPDLPSMFSDEAIKKCARDLVSIGTDRMLEAVVAFTPVRTGNLKTSWHIEGTPHFELGGRDGPLHGQSCQQDDLRLRIQCPDASRDDAAAAEVIGRLVPGTEVLTQAGDWQAVNATFRHSPR